tara:strand:- start:229 stop:465 length:237 start_codon:yes stop_codon:yes gene_type:complete
MSEVEDLTGYAEINWHDEGLEGNNNGYIYGIYFLSEEILEGTISIFDGEIEDVMWFKTEEERDREFYILNNSTNVEIM